MSNNFNDFLTIRKRLNLTQTDMAEVMNMSQPTFFRLENFPETATLKTVYRLIDFYKEELNKKGIEDIDWFEFLTKQLK